MLLSSCISSSTETQSGGDTTVATGYEDFSEVSPFTIKEELRSQTMVIQGKRKTIQDYLEVFYAPDTFTTHLPEDSTDAPHYIITDARVIEGNFFVSERNCEPRTLLMTSRGDFVEQEFYDLLVVGKDSGGNMILVDKITVDGSQGQTSTTVTAELYDLSVDNTCRVLEVSSSSEGGDVNLHKDDWIEFFVADKQSLRSVLRLQTERTDIQDYQPDRDENQNAFSEIREVEMLETSSRGLYDLGAHYVSRQNGAVVEERDEIYRYNGEEYVLTE